jgi:hypothetical protein
MKTPGSLLRHRNAARTRNLPTPGSFVAGMLLVSLALCISPNAGAQNPPAPATAPQVSSGGVKALFEPMPNFDVDQNEDVALDFYVFGYLEGTPRIEGHRTTTSYKLQEGKPMPGALGICRKFIENVRQAGGEILYDNNRNIVTARMSQGGRETWAEIACDKDRYRTNIVEQAAGQGQSDTAPGQPNATDAKVREAVKANADKAFDELNTPEGGKKNLAAPPAGSSSLIHNPGPDPEPFTFAKAAGGKTSPPAGSRPPINDGKTERKTVTIISKAPAGTKFSIVVNSGPGTDLAAPAPCADKPTLARKLVGAKKWSNIVLKRGFADQIRARKLDLVDNNTWSCHTKDGALAEGALVSDRPLP